MRKWLLLCIVFITACSSNEAQQTSQFLLPTKQARAVASEDAPILLVKTDLDDYLNQAGLVYRVSKTEVMVAKQSRWAHDISDQITKRMVNDLRAKQTKYWPIQRNSALQLNNQAQLVVRLSRFNGEFTGNAELSGEWLLVDGQGKLINSEYFEINKPLKNEGYEELVFALSKGLEELTTAIAKQLYK